MRTVGATPARTTQSDIHLLKQDIRYIKPDSLQLSDQHLQPYKRISFWVVQDPTYRCCSVLYGSIVSDKPSVTPNSFESSMPPRTLCKSLRALKSTPRMNRQRSMVRSPMGCISTLRDIFDVSPGGLNPELVRQRCEAGGVSLNLRRHKLLIR